MKALKHFNEYIELPKKPLIENGGIFFATKIEHKDLSVFHGDARSLGYPFDDGDCSIVTYEQVVGVLADDTFELIEECREISNKKTPVFSILEEDKNGSKDFDSSQSELLINYNGNKLYKDKSGFWSHTFYCHDDYQGSKIRVTDESAELFREVNKEYQRLVKKHNEMTRQYRDNLKLLKNTLDI